MPLALDLAHGVLLELAALRRENKQIKYLKNIKAHNTSCRVSLIFKTIKMNQLQIKSL